MRGRPFPMVISAPSGAGKTTLSRALVEREPDLEFSISATTRPARHYEEEGRDYFFADDADFDRMIAAGELLEWAEVHGRRYGTPRRGIELWLEQDRCVLLDIDVEGARQVRAAYPDAVLVFVLPPSVAELKRRLSDRRSESESERRHRLRTALHELDAIAEFDYVIVNDDFDQAVAALRGIVHAERQRRGRHAGLDDLVGRLRRQLNELLHGS